MLFSESNMKIIHWEYNNELIGLENKSEPTIKIGLLRNIDTDKPTGVYFRWTYLLERGNEIFLHFVSEDSYKIHNIPDFTLADFGLLFYKSGENFKRVFKERMDLIDLSVPIMMTPIPDDSWNKVLEELKK